MKRTALLTLLLLCFGVSHAVEVEILDADKLEVRPITLPGRRADRTDDYHRVPGQAQS